MLATPLRRVSASLHVVTTLRRAMSAMPVKHVGVQVTRMELQPGKWSAYEEQTDQISREVAKYDGICKGLFFAYMNMGTKPGCHTDIMSLVIFDSVNAAQAAMQFSPPTRQELQTIMLRPPIRSVYDGVVFSNDDHLPLESDACYAHAHIRTRVGMKDECFAFLKESSPKLGKCIWLGGLSPVEDDADLTVCAAFPSYKDVWKARDQVKEFLKTLAPFATNQVPEEFEIHDRGGMYAR